MPFRQPDIMMEMKPDWGSGGTDRWDRTTTLLVQSQPHRLLCYIGISSVLLFFQGGVLVVGTLFSPTPSYSLRLSKA